ncbi:MAG: hypothetical protein JJLCMIEE_00191 [Acidimicrobiales bacterium]|nr:MAG: hypothetical protein EDR02_01225 [Actinomycetota bacterium]MBV6507151.1 hypothetical protein [Acidimicrobiales bacterium]RIK05554.1 MAG: hypothetical protein DCC48_09700 [Acidobacteriota bacterium]
MLPVTINTLRIFLHLLAVAIWVGGMLTLAGLVGTVRQLGDDAPRRVARQFNRLAWPAYAVVWATGIWNVLSVDLTAVSLQYQITLGVKLVLVLASGIAAFLHAEVSSRVVLAIGGVVAAAGALGAMFLGVML